jgi:hypothetical protein
MAAVMAADLAAGLMKLSRKRMQDKEIRDRRRASRGLVEALRLSSWKT